MKQFLVFVRKEFLHISRDVRTILILLLMPVVQIILFGFALSNEIQDVKVLFVSNEPNEVAASINYRILSSDYFIPAQSGVSATEAESLMKSGGASLIVNYSRNFSELMVKEGTGQIELIADGSDPNMASSILLYTSAIITETLADKASMPIGGQGIVSVSTELLYYPQMKSSYNVAAMLISGLALMMPAMLLSGMIFPISNMPQVLQYITKFVPASWYIGAVKKLMIQGLPLSSVLTEIGALTTMAVVFLAISFKQFKYRLE